MKNIKTKKWLVAMLILSFVLLVFANHAVVDVEAATFSPRTTAPSSSDKYWIHTSAGGLNECIKVNGNSVLPNCVGYAWGRAYEILGSRPNLAKTDAKTWYTENISRKAYSYGSTPKLGAIACWAYKASSAGHVAVVEKIEGSKVTISESHYGGGNFNTRVINADGSGYLSNFQGYIYIGDFTQTNSPTGVIDSITTDCNSVKIRGWAYDKDDVNRSVNIHVYIGSNGIGLGVANQYRPDVNEVYKGVGEYHGFDITCVVPPELTGERIITVYALDADEGNHTNLSANINTSVNIPMDKVAPVISDVKVVDIDATGYTVKCTVTDNTGVNRVQFPTWTAPEQDDIQAAWQNNSLASGKKEGNVYTYRVNISDHNNEKVGYVTHIYAYDNYDNAVCVKLSDFGYEDISVQYTVSYNANGGSGAPSAQKKVHGKTLTLSETVPKRDLYNFKGWATSSNATNAIYQAGSSYTNNASTTLYAVWQHVCANDHNYTYQLTTSPTISATGKISGTCTRCKATTTITLPKLNTTDYTYTEIATPTCTSNGTGRYTWKTTSYGSYYFDTIIEKTGHKLGEWLTTKKASCTEAGESRTDCSSCEYFETKELEAIGHAYEEVVIKPTCEESGYTTHVCGNCEDSYVDNEVKALGHNYVNSVCTVCGSKDPNAAQEIYDVFKDISHGAWYASAVQYVYDNGLMSGNNGLFKPEGNVTRAQLVTTLYNIQGKPVVTDYSACTAFKDVKKGQWYTDAICWAYNVGVASGNSNTKMFNVNDPVTRQQLATFFYNFAEYKGLDTKASADISGMKGANEVASYAQKAMRWAVGSGIISGSKTVVNGTAVYDLKPTGTATRAQLASILQNFCKNNNL